MKLYFATKRNTNGNRSYLEIDTEKKQYSTQDQFLHRSDFVEVKRSEYNELIRQASEDGYHVLIRL